MNDTPEKPSAGTTPPNQRVQAYAHDAGTQAKAAGHDVKDQLGAAAEQAKSAAGDAVERVKDEAVHATEKAKEHGRKVFETQKHRVATEIHAYSEAARGAADRLNDESDTNLGSYVASAADYLDRMGNRIDERGLEELVSDVQGMARRRPEIFYGGLFVAGLAAARFLKASSRPMNGPRIPAASGRPGNWTPEPNPVVPPMTSPGTPVMPPAYGGSGKPSIATAASSTVSGPTSPSSGNNLGGF